MVPGSARLEPAPTRSWEEPHVDLLILDVALISFIVLVIGQIVMPERRSATVTAETAAAS